jgi:DHA2 family multidrug resistance protein
MSVQGVTRPWLGILAVLCGAFISTLNGRLSSFGLADIRGAVHAGFDEGAWIVTAQTAGQMLVTPLAIWAAGPYGPRRILMWGVALFTVAETLLPLSQNLGQLLWWQFLGGVGSGTFIPLTLPVVLRSTPPRLWAYGIAVYALNLELSLNISASLEAWYIDHGGWQMIFWQNVPLALVMGVCLAWGLPSQPWPEKRKVPHLFGAVSMSIGLSLIYAALDQGNRLDWLNSGVVVGLLAGGAMLMVVALVHLWLLPSDWFHLRLAQEWPLPLLLVLVSVLRLTILSTSYLIPQYLILVRGYRTFEVGQALVWIAIPQLITAPLAAIFLRRFDSRWVACTGLLAIAAACGVVANTMTAQWGPEQFLVTQLVQAFGQSLALSGIVFTSVLHMRPEIQLTFGGLLQTARLMGGEAGLAITATLLRVKEQSASNLIGQHVTQGGHDTVARIATYTGALAQASPSGTAPARAVALLASAVREAANMQAFLTCFAAIAAVSVAALAVVVIVGRAPAGPARHMPFDMPWRKL